jgi:hypothetical protein
VAEHRLTRASQRAAVLYRIAAFLPLLFIPAASRLGTAGVVVAAVVSVGLVVILWRQADRPDVVRLDEAGLHFLRRGRVVATIALDELRSISDHNTRYLTWKGTGRPVHTLTGFEHQRELFDELSRLAPNLAALPGA